MLLIRHTALFNGARRLRIRGPPPVPAERVAAEDPHVLMQEVHDRMCAALEEIRRR